MLADVILDIMLYWLWFSVSPLQNRHRRRVMFRVAQGDVQLRSAASNKRKLLPLSMQHHVRLARFFTADFNVVPAQLRADTGAEGLGNGLLGCKAHGQKRRGLAMRKGVSNFARQ